MPLEQNPATSVTATISGTPNVAVTNTPSVNATCTGTVAVSSAIVDMGQVTFSGTAYTVKSVTVNATTIGDNTIVSAVTDKKIRMIGYTLYASTTTGVIWKSGAATTLIPLTAWLAGLTLFASPMFGYVCETAASEALVLNVAAGNVRGNVIYVEV